MKSVLSVADSQFSNLIEDTKSCDIFPVSSLGFNLKSLSFKFFKLWENFQFVHLGEILKFLNFDFLDVNLPGIGLSIGITLPSNLKIVFVLPPVACFVMIVVG